MQSWTSYIRFCGVVSKVHNKRNYLLLCSQYELLSSLLMLSTGVSFPTDNSSGCYSAEWGQSNWLCEVSQWCKSQDFSHGRTVHWETDSESGTLNCQLYHLLTDIDIQHFFPQTLSGETSWYFLCIANLVLNRLCMCDNVLAIIFKPFSVATTPS